MEPQAIFLMWVVEKSFRFRLINVKNGLIDFLKKDSIKKEDMASQET